MFNLLLAEVTEALENKSHIKRYYSRLKRLCTFGQEPVYMVETDQGTLFINVRDIQDARDIMTVQFKGYNVKSITEIKCKGMLYNPITLKPLTARQGT